jgi:hypothetical protein
VTKKEAEKPRSRDAEPPYIVALIIIIIITLSPAQLYLRATGSPSPLNSAYSPLCNVRLLFQSRGTPMC